MGISNPSFGNSSSESIPWVSRGERIRTMYNTVQSERGGKDQAIIAVVEKNCLRKMCEKMGKRSWKFWRVRSRVLVTRRSHLQEAILEVLKNSKVKLLTIMACEGVGEIYFEVSPPNIETLKVLRCGQQAGLHGDLIINGASKFDDTRLDEWESCPHPDAKVYLGQGVRIGVDLERSRFWSESKSHISLSEQQEIRDALNNMQNTNKEGNWWDQWKGSVASILGILVMGHKVMAGGSASASGYCFSIKYGPLAFNYAQGCFSASAIATAAGPAILLGAVTGAAVYLIPWEKFFPWLGNIMSSWGTWFKSMWERFWGWWNGSSETTARIPGHFRTHLM